jgi:UDP-N-acetylmuramoyl-tripeptide--D-alanyl-D-alanine ligase
MENIFNLFYETSGVSTDTRKIEKNCLFICLSGSNFDGNEFAQEALEKGAKYVIVDNKNFIINENVLFVENSLKFLQNLANYHRKKFQIPIIGITGSNGKTTSKELINCVLSKKYNTLSTSGNLNNHIGVPLTLLNLNAKHELAIIEMGANKFKDIEELCNIAEPTHGIITNIGKAHLEGFLTFEGVIKTKCELYKAIEEVNGTIFYNGDDDILKSHLPINTQTFSFGTKPDNSIVGELIELNPFVKMRWKSNNTESEIIQTKMIGSYNFYNFLAAICIGEYFQVQQKDISDAISSYEPSNNRSQIVNTEKNTIILDAYNANPTSMKSAIESFILIKHPKKIAILGDMFELGSDSKKEHFSLIELIKSKGIISYFVGTRFNEFKNHSSDKLHFYETKKSLQNELKNKK